MATAATSRRRARFSLRVLSVVIAVIGCWLGYQVNWIRQRHQFFEVEEAPFRQYGILSQRDIEVTRAPGVLWLFGEHGYSPVQVWVTSESPESLNDVDVRHIADARRLFPEADIVMFHSDGTHSWLSVAP